MPATFTTASSRCGSFVQCSVDCFGPPEVAVHEARVCCLGCYHVEHVNLAVGSHEPRDSSSADAVGAAGQCHDLAHLNSP